jgi:hypothetical protein
MDDIVIEIIRDDIVIVESCQQGLPGRNGSEASISTDQNNRLTRGTDDGLYVKDDLTPDPLAYYILAKA